MQVDDLDEVRARAEKLRIRTVCSADLDDIRASHLHPRDVGAITSVDQPVPAASWRWGGPDWEKRSVSGRVASVSIGGDADLWSGLLSRRVVENTIELDDGSELRFVEGQGVISIELEVDGTTITLP